MIRRHYIEVADVAGSNETQVALAEQLIDQYVGPQDKFINTRIDFKSRLTGISGDGKTLYDTSPTSQMYLQNGYFGGCHIEIIGGTGAGQTGYVTNNSDDNKSVTLYEAFSTAPDATSIYRIYQLAKFPRRQDKTYFDGDYYLGIPQAVKDACIAQTKFIIAKGDDYFIDDGVDLQSESFLNYSYQKASGSGGVASAVVQFVSPEARIFLKGIYNRKGNYNPNVHY